MRLTAPLVASPRPTRVPARRAVAAPPAGRGRLVVSAKKDSGKDSGKKKDKAEGAPAEPHASEPPAAPAPAASGGSGNGGEPKAPKTKTGSRAFDATKPCAPPAVFLVAQRP